MTGVVLIPVRCPHCDYGQVVKHGKMENDKQRYLCQQPECPTQIFILDDDSQVIFLNQKRVLLQDD